MNRRPSKQQQAKRGREFEQAAEELLTNIGARRQPEGSSHKWKFDSRFGPLGVTVHGVEVLGQFEDHVAARTHTHCNPHSGKWNHFFYYWRESRQPVGLLEPDGPIEELRMALLSVKA